MAMYGPLEDTALRCDYVVEYVITGMKLGSQLSDTDDVLWCPHHRHANATHVVLYGIATYPVAYYQYVDYKEPQSYLRLPL